MSSKFGKSNKMKLALPHLNVTLDLVMKPKKGKQVEMAIARIGRDTEIESSVCVSVCGWKSRSL